MLNEWKKNLNVSLVTNEIIMTKEILWLDKVSWSDEILLSNKVLWCYENKYTTFKKRLNMKKIN